MVAECLISALCDYSRANLVPLMQQPLWYKAELSIHSNVIHRANPLDDMINNLDRSVIVSADAQNALLTATVQEP
jgi:hypothetical protein